MFGSRLLSSPAFATAILVATLFSMVPRAIGQETNLNPLHPADTSSPRATLTSFLEITDALAEEWRSGQPVDLLYRWSRAAAETMNLSETADGGSWEEQIQRIALLKAILDRVALPPPDSIPGMEEVAATGLSTWTVPGTRITIARQESGTLAGEYLFSANTVADLEIMYRRARSLPPKDGTRFDLDAFLQRNAKTGGQEDPVRYRLSGIEADDPRSTLESFLEAVNESFALVIAAEAGLAADPPTVTEEQAGLMEDKAADLLVRATDALDLSQVPKAQREDVAIESALQLKGILDRISLPPIGYVPDASMVAEERIPGRPFRWNIPGTAIEIAEVTEGPRTGEFLFSPSTVFSLADTYEKLKDLPYRQNNDVGIPAEYTSPQTSPSFYESYISTPGLLVPSLTPFGRMIRDLPEPFKTLYLDQTLWQWIGLGLLVVATIVMAMLIIVGASRLARPLRPPLRHWILAAAPALVAGLVVAGFNLLNRGLNITGWLLTDLRVGVYAIVMLLLAWLSWRLLRALAETVISSPGISDRGIDASLIRIAAGLLAVSIGGWAVVEGLGDLGVDIVPILAGLGVGGLAAALAIRPTLENLIGGLILYVDKPVRVGDFCTFGSMTGTVENIGVRSTQIRGMDRTLISIPNAKFADMEIVNWAHCDRMLVQTTVGLRYETTPDQLRHVLVRLREMLHAHPKIDSDSLRVRFAGYGKSSLDIAIRIYALTREWNEFHAIREDVYFRVAEIIAASGTNLALPSQTLYMGRDSGLDGTRSQQAEEEVQAWRQHNDLPFPSLRPERVDELQGTLDYPPQGSPLAKMRPSGEEKLSDQEPATETAAADS